jgi:hypothetical protein
LTFTIDGKISYICGDPVKHMLCGHWDDPPLD